MIIVGHLAGWGTGSSGPIHASGIWPSAMSLLWTWSVKVNA